MSLPGTLTFAKGICYLLLVIWLAPAVLARGLSQTLLHLEGSETPDFLSGYITGVGMDLTSNYGYERYLCVCLNGNLLLLERSPWPLPTAPGLISQKSTAPRITERPCMNSPLMRLNIQRRSCGRLVSELVLTNSIARRTAATSI